MSRQVIGMGETILDILFRNNQPVAAVHGGSSFNSIISVGRVGVPCTFVGYTGGDIVGQQLLDFMHQNGVDTRYVQVRPDEKSAVSLAYLNDQGDASYVFHKGIPHVAPSWELPPVHEGDVLLYGSYYAACTGMRPLVMQMLEQATQAGAVIYYDLNFRRSHQHELEALTPVILSNFRQSTIVRGSADDFEIMYGTRDAREIYDAHIRAYCSLFICTNGADQITICTPTGCYDFQVPHIDNVVSTVGAGDNFNAGFVCSLIWHNITRQQLQALDRDAWAPLISDACAFAGNACQSTDNYIKKDFRPHPQQPHPHPLSEERGAPHPLSQLPSPRRGVGGEAGEVGACCFDYIYDRMGTNDVKHAQLTKYFGSDDLLPLWVADMDFATPDFIVDAIRQRLEHPILGYTELPEDYWPSVIDWIRDHHQWTVQQEWLHFIPGIVKGIGMVVNVFTQPGDKIIIQPPVYHPFRITPEGNGRQIVWSPLRLNPGGTYSMDFQNLEQVCDEQCKLLILSNPHNPAGICWDRETLQRLAHFCAQHHLLVISDEIHCDMALFGHKHIPFATVSEEAAHCSITFGAPSKTFNIAGVVSSYCIVPDDTLRSRFFQWLEANEFDYPHMFAPLVTMVAFRQGEPWRQQLIKYLEGNVQFVIDYCQQNIPQIHPLRPQASFLIWLDCRALDLDHDALLDLFINHAHLALNDGEMFGPGGQGFMRMNIATPRSVLQEAMDRLRQALS